MVGSGCGADGCRGGWFYLLLLGEQASFGVAGTFAEVVTRASSRLILVDIPIGLRAGDGTPRHCDRLARQVLGPRRASVFSAPIREVLTVTDYAEANALSRRLAGRGLSRQTFNIAPKIAEVDALLADRGSCDLVREAHPELCFWGLAGGAPMCHGKRTRAGFEERLKVLRRHWSGADRFIPEAYGKCRAAGVARDDVVDAAVLAVTAASSRDPLRTLPEVAERDSHGLPMEMVYRLA